MAILSLYTDSKRLICAFGLFGIVTAQPCYWKSNNTVRAQDAAGIYPCPNTETHSDGTQLCCLVGSQCGIDGICRFPEATVDSGPPDSPGRSGWNTGGCTDPSYSDPVCPTECNDWGRSRIVWDQSTSLWHCCGHENCTDTPTNETFEAASPQDWRAIVDTPDTTSSGATSTAASTSLPASTKTTTPKSEHDEGLNVGAQVGIGISSTMFGVGIILAVIYFARRRKKKSIRTKEHKPITAEPSNDDHQKQNNDQGIALMKREYSEAMSEEKHEMSTESTLSPAELDTIRTAPRELSTEPGRHELEGNTYR